MNILVGKHDMNMKGLFPKHSAENSSPIASGGVSGPRVAVGFYIRAKFRERTRINSSL